MPELILQDIVAQGRAGALVGPVEASVSEGELLCLLGIDGPLLTLLMDAIATGNGLNGGSVAVDDTTLFPGRPRWIPIAHVPAKILPGSRASVEKLLESALKEHNTPREEWDERKRHALSVLELERHAARRTADLTEPVLARATLAASIVWGPSALLVDQLPSVLPAHLRNDLRMLLRDLPERLGIPVVYATCDAREALALGSEVILLHGGRVVQQASPLLLYKRPVNRAVADLTGDGNYIPGRIQRCGGGFALVDTAAGAFRAALPEGYEPADDTPTILLVRPEALHIERMPADENTLTGHIEHVQYQGPIARYRFRSGDVMLKIDESNPRFASPPPNELYAWADPDDVVVLPG